MVNPVFAPSSASAQTSRSRSPIRPVRIATSDVSTVTASAAPHPVRALIESLGSTQDIGPRLRDLYELQRILVEIPESKDIFRLSGGFEAVFACLNTTVPADQDEDFSVAAELFKCVFNIFSDALMNSSMNHRYLAEKIGVEQIRHAVLKSELLEHNCRQVLGILFAFAISDFSISAIFVSLSRSMSSTFPTDHSPADIIMLLHDRINSSLSRDFVRNPFIVTCIHDILITIANSDIYTTVGAVVGLTALARSSIYSAVAIYKTDIMDRVLPLMWDNNGLDPRIIDEYKLLIKSLIHLGVKTATAKEFFRHAIQSDDVALLLLDGIRNSREPDHIVFDLSLHGYSTIEINSLNRPFPPVSSGYTITAWIKFDTFGSGEHTMLLGILDNSKKCFTVLYLENEPRTLILQTSLRSSKGYIKFKAFPFQAGQWYFISVLHKKPRVGSTSSLTSLYVNGEFIESAKCPYPSLPPNDGLPHAFIGTPSDLSTGPGLNPSHSTWRLSSLNVFEDLLSGDVLAVHYRLGPRYYGNFQDSLARFQTYEASANLTLRNESQNAGREESSDIISVIRGRASSILPETKVLLAIHGRNVVDSTLLQQDHGFKQPPKSVIQLGRNHLLVVNAAVADINIAFNTLHGLGIGSGDPIPVVHNCLDDAAWRVGGSALGLKMAQLAKTADQMCNALSVAFEIVRENWRNSDDLERVHGYAILANIIKLKQVPGIVNKRLLEIVLEFVGFNFKHQNQSLLICPVAYKTLIVDYDIWRNADSDTLKLYFEQFIVFGVGSKFHAYNSKRLNRMRIIKKFIQCLKSGSFSKDAINHFLPAFRSLIHTNPSVEVMRSLSLFIVYSFSEDASISSATSSKSQSSLALDKSDGKGLQMRDIGFMVLQTFTDVLCTSSSSTIKRFAKTVTNKWVLFLISLDDPRGAVAGTRILARLLVVHGPSYVNKFAQRPGGFIIMRDRLKSRWNIPQLWPLCLAILFGIDAATIELSDTLDLFSLIEMFRKNGKATVLYPEVFTVLGSMLKAGTLALISEGNDDDSENDENVLGNTHTQKSTNTENFGHYLQVLTQFFSEMHASCPAFQDFCATPIFISEILGILFPAICNTESVSPEIELQYRDNGFTLDSGDIVVRPASKGGNPAQIMKSIRGTSPSGSQLGTFESRPRASSFRRGSSFVLVASEESSISPSSTRDTITPSSTTTKSSHSTTRPNMNEIKKGTINRVVEGLLEMVVAVFVEQVLTRKDFSELTVSILIPPTFQEYQIYFETYLFRNTIAQLNTSISLNMRILLESRTLSNFGKFAQQMADSVSNGWFLGGAEPLLELIGMVVEYLQQPAVEKLRSVRVSHQVVSNLRSSFVRLALFRLSELDDQEADPSVKTKFLERLFYWQNIFLSPALSEDNMIKVVCYLLYNRLVDMNMDVREAATNIWRMILVHRPVEASLVLDNIKSLESIQLANGFKKLTEVDNVSFLAWVDQNRSALDEFFLEDVSKEWEIFVASENKIIDENSKIRNLKRRERLRQSLQDETSARVNYQQHRLELKKWIVAIYNTEHVKCLRNLQDLQDTYMFLSSEYAKLEADLTRPLGVIPDGNPERWRLDLTEGKDRMRKKMIPDTRNRISHYLSKEEDSNVGFSEGAVERVTKDLEDLDFADSSGSSRPNTDSNSGRSEQQNTTEINVESEDGFEIVEDPRGQEVEDDAYEDKNRKVIRSLEQGDRPVEMWNVSRIIGLDSIEGLLIQGQSNLYLIDNFFQRSNREIVNLWEAPIQERDQYLQTIAGASHRQRSDSRRDHETRHWALDDLVAVSRRQFLFRNVALEFFFADGRSFLITAQSVKERDHIHSKLINKVSNSDSNSGAAFSDELWRSALQPSLQGSFAGQLGKIANVFVPGNSNLVTRRWVRGEISNFYYLMLINTMAGRTYNDLTQYPVFPWVIADYTSEELDLSNPATFRDLSKPMGAQTASREKEFRDRYESFAELDDANSPPFHYGTHFSSAMIVSSYLIRLEPFVQSYLLIQGGHFDHADRLFYSVRRAWESASRDNMADVRELIPEFFYLAEFLENSNGFNFGTLQGGEEINSVELPPWAKGDPKIFIEKNREALESPYVSQHLHEWVDLVFGFKQRGEAAVEAVNVFHHLSYHGAIDLDKIEDPLERMATVGIIHNFGQTPHQVFTRPHPQREVLRQAKFEVDKDTDSLLNMLSSVNEMRRLESSLSPFKVDRERLLKQFDSSFTAFLPPSYDRMVEWGYSDDGIRFKLIESGKLIGHFEKLHQNHLTCVKVADPRTLVTGGYDCMICVWRMQGNMKSMDIQLKACLRGHTRPIVSLAISRSFSTIVSASEDGVTIVWDLNRLRFVRQLEHNKAVIKSVAISDDTGEILTSDGNTLFLWTINGDRLLERPIPEDKRPRS
ncbi:uncharacterized protein V1516DRAFT_668782 [Lipomyces oligophaga]|uniref:uncharacterized protein n=1 Tax=Lipomyces oligophaga TaxID=45792 RepID=UPI0034CE00E6